MFPLFSLHSILGRRDCTTRIAGLILVGLALVGCATTPPTDNASGQGPGNPTAPSSGRAEALLVVDCLLPGQLRKLGRMTFLTPRHPVKTTAQDCEIRGGEYVAYDRADYRTALNIWLPQAQAGDKEAQTYVGEIYEKGLGVPADYATAATWYRKAAEQGHTRAQINLGHLYEKGLGVERDPLQALQWYRQASGLREAIALDAGTITLPGVATTTQAEVQELRQEVERWKSETATLRQQLEDTQQQLERTRQQLEQRQRQTEVEQRQLEQARLELDRRKQQTAARNDAELQRLEAQLQQREAELQRQQQEVARLEQSKAQLEQETARHREQLVRFDQQRQRVAYAGPTIEMVDPPQVGTRGVSVVNVSKEIVGQSRDVVGKVTSPAGLLTFTVNDRPEQLNEHGMFRVPITVRGSGAPVTIVAIDQQGKRASVTFTLAPGGDGGVPAQAAGPSPRLAFGTYYALVIGNETYTHWPALNTPKNDARQVAELLERKYGFKTRLLLDATRFDILQAFNEMRKTLTENDNLLIYYAGHGHYENKIERGYWVPVDGHTDSDVNWISTFAVTDILSAMSARHVLVVADSCYSGALTRSALARLEAGMTAEAREHWLKTIAEKRSRTVLSSGGLQPVLDSGGGDHSVFAKAFLDVLATNNEILEGQRLGLEVAARVSYAASAALVNQDPQYAPIRFAGHEAGDFVLLPTTLQ
jgi:uncharacterized caspase-like protein